MASRSFQRSEIILVYDTRGCYNTLFRGSYIVNWLVVFCVRRVRRMSVSRARVCVGRRPRIFIKHYFPLYFDHFGRVVVALRLIVRSSHPKKPVIASVFLCLTFTVSDNDSREFQKLSFSLLGRDDNGPTTAFAMFTMPGQRLL